MVAPSDNTPLSLITLQLSLHIIVLLMASTDIPSLLIDLISKNPDTAAKRFEDDDWSPLQLSASLGLPVTSHVMATADESVPRLSTLHIAAFRGHTGIISSDPEMTDVQDQFGFTPLHYAVFKRHKPTVERLLSLGAIPSKESQVSRSALHIEPNLRLMLFQVEGDLTVGLSQAVELPRAGDHTSSCRYCHHKYCNSATY